MVCGVFSIVFALTVVRARALPNRSGSAPESFRRRRSMPLARVPARSRIIPGAFWTRLGGVQEAPGEILGFFWADFGFLLG